MFKRAPEAMYRALTLHNNVIRRAKYAHCGSIVQQEGDSFTLAFHSAVDAVAFSLQVRGAGRPGRAGTARPAPHPHAHPTHRTPRRTHCRRMLAQRAWRGAAGAAGPDGGGVA
jgi:class 3 adenylate cyclase